MAIDGKNHRAPTATARVSQGSRIDARPADAFGIEDPETEWERLNRRKRDIELQLATVYSTSSYRNREMEIHRTQQDSSSVWGKELHRLDNEKFAIKKELLLIANRLSELKPVMKRLKEMDDAERNLTFTQNLAAMNVLLAENNRLLARIVALLEK